MYTNPFDIHFDAVPILGSNLNDAFDIMKNILVVPIPIKSKLHEILDYINIHDDM